MTPKSNTSFALFLIFLLGAFLPVESRCQGQISAGDPSSLCLPRLQAQHYSVYCMDNETPDQFAAPKVLRACDTIRELSFAERYETFGCTAGGFKDYFDLSQWTVRQIFGDGGVEVTGAPDTWSVDETDGSLLCVTPKGLMRMEILLPAGGIVAFDWEHVGGSDLAAGIFQVLINGKPAQVPGLTEGEGAFRWPVSAGDLLTMQFRPDTLLSVRFENFRFLTNARGSLMRTWTATEEMGRRGSFTQFITVEQPSIADVIFPEDITETGSTVTAASPDITGYPFLDKDGNPATTEDRILLTDNNCAFQVEYIDEVQASAGCCILLRRWIVRDSCNGNTMQEMQTINLTGNPASGHSPEDLLPHLPGQKIGQPNTTPSISLNSNTNTPTTL